MVRALVQIQTFSRNWSRNGPDLHSKVRILLNMEERTLKISNLKHKTMMQWRLFNARKVKNFNKNLILLYRFGFVRQLGPDLVQISIEKYPGFGAMLINPGPI